MTNVNLENDELILLLRIMAHHVCSSDISKISFIDNLFDKLMKEAGVDYKEIYNHNYAPFKQHEYSVYGNRPVIDIAS